MNPEKHEESEEIEGKGELTPDQEAKIISFVTSTPNLDDTTFHAFCEGLGIDPHEGEEVVYRHVNNKQAELELKNFIDSGASKNKGYVKPDQMRKGMKVEEEHVKGTSIPKPMQKVLEAKIVKDHVAGEHMPNYYDFLAPMEEKAKKSAAYQQGYNDYIKQAGPWTGVPGHLTNILAGGAMGPIRGSEMHAANKMMGIPEEDESFLIKHPWLSPALGGLAGSVAGTGIGYAAGNSNVGGRIGGSLGALITSIMQQHQVAKELERIKSISPKSHERLTSR